MEIQEAQKLGRKNPRQIFNFINKALQPLVPLLLGSLTKQCEDTNDDTWNEAMAAGACLALISQCVQDNIVAYVLPFVQKNVAESD